MFFLRRWISVGSLWFSHLLVLILSSATGWWLGFQRENDAVGKSIKSDQDATAGGVVSLSCRLGSRSLILCYTQDLAPPQPQAAVPTKIDEHVYMNSKGKTISGGASGLVERLPSGDVVKSPWPGLRAAQCRRDMTTEANIYKKLGPHPRLVKMIDWNPHDCCLTMEYMPNGSLGDYLRAHAHDGEISTRQCLQWIQEAAEGLQLLHSANIIHSDVEPKNFLLDGDLGLRIADFSGSSLDGSQASACVGTRFEPPTFNLHPTVRDDLFSFGSTMYTIITGQYPFQELPSDEVVERYKAHEFPDVTGIMCGEIIDQCWRGEVDSAQQIYDFVEAKIKLPCSVRLACINPPEKDLKLVPEQELLPSQG